MFSENGSQNWSNPGKTPWLPKGYPGTPSGTGIGIGIGIAIEIGIQNGIGIGIGIGVGIGLGNWTWTWNVHWIRFGLDLVKCKKRTRLDICYYIELHIIREIRSVGMW